MNSQPTDCGQQTEVPRGKLYEPIKYKYANSECVLNSPVPAATIGACLASKKFFNAIIDVCCNGNFLFTDLTPTMSTLSGSTDASFQPRVLIREVIAMLSELEQDDFGLHKISCNEGIACMPDTLLPTEKPFSNHLRRQVSVTMARKCLGDTRSTPYVVKLFCTGNVQIPGCVNEDVGTGIDAMDRLLQIIRKIMKNPDIKASKLRTIVRNYKFKIIGDNFKLDLPRLYQVLLIKQQNRAYKDLYEKIMKPEIPTDYKDSKNYSEYHLKQAQQNVLDRFMRLSAKTGPLSILSVSYDPGRASSLILRIGTCRPPRQNKSYIPHGEVVIRIFISGKIIISANTPEESQEIHSWLTMIFQAPGVIINTHLIPYMDEVMALYPISDDESSDGDDDSDDEKKQ